MGRAMMLKIAERRMAYATFIEISSFLYGQLPRGKTASVGMDASGAARIEVENEECDEIQRGDLSGGGLAPILCLGQ
jgi:hypothetical protein